MTRSRTRSAELEHGSRALYERPRYYDQAYQRHREDLAFYTGLAKRCRGPVLEFGAGTGRVTRALAEAGVRVLGVDQSAEMLTRARQRLARLPRAVQARVELRRADLRRLRLQRRFELVLAPFNLLMHLYTRDDQERALAAVRAHLTPSGRFAFDVSMPDLGALRRDPARVYRCRPVFDPTDGTRHAYGEAFDYDPVSQVQTVRMMFQRLDRPEVDRTTPLTLRQYFPEELLALLHYNGFRVRARYGDFEGGPLDAGSDTQVIVAEPYPRARTRR